MRDIYVSHSCRYDFVNELYEPIKSSILIEKYNLVLPHENSDVMYDAKSLFSKSKNLVFLIDLSHLSIGKDIEMGMAFMKGFLIIGICKKGFDLSRSQKFVCDELIEYTEINEVFYKVDEIISNNEILKSKKL